MASAIITRGELFGILSLAEPRVVTHALNGKERKSYERRSVSIRFWPSRASHYWQISNKAERKLDMAGNQIRSVMVSEVGCPSTANDSSLQMLTCCIGFFPLIRIAEHRMKPLL